MGLGIRRQEDETWYDCAMRYAKKYDLESEVKDDYDQGIKDGDSEEEAAWGACYEWDILEVIE